MMKKEIFYTKEQPLLDGEYWEFNKTSLTEETKKLIIEERTMYGEQKESKYYCEICDKTMTLYNYCDHIKTNLYGRNFLLYQNFSNK